MKWLKIIAAVKANSASMRYFMRNGGFRILGMVMLLVISAGSCDSAKKAKFPISPFVTGGGNAPQAPLFDAAAGPESITLTNINTPDATSYIVFWYKLKDSSDQAVFVFSNVDNFERSDEIPVNDPEEKGAYTITGLEANMGYLVAVASVRHGKVSEPRFNNDTIETPEIDDVEALYPYTTDLMDKEPSFTLSGGNNYITVTDLQVPRECRYRLYCKKQNDPDSAWKLYDTFQDNWHQKVTIPLSHTLYGLSQWTVYQVKACAVSMGGIEGKSVTKDVTTAYEYDITLNSLMVRNPNVTIFADISQVPPGTVSYSIEVNLSMDRLYWGQCCWGGCFACAARFPDARTNRVDSIAPTITRVAIYNDTLPGTLYPIPTNDITNINGRFTVRFKNAFGNEIAKTEQFTFY